MKPEYNVGEIVLYKGSLYTVYGVNTRDACSFVNTLRQNKVINFGCGNDCNECHKKLDKHLNNQLLFSYTLIPYSKSIFIRLDNLSGVTHDEISSIPKVSPTRKRYI